MHAVEKNMLLSMLVLREHLFIVIHLISLCTFTNRLDFLFINDKNTVYNLTKNNIK